MPVSSLDPPNRPPLGGFGGPTVSKMVPIEISSPYSYSTFIHTTCLSCTVWPQYTTRHTDRQTDGESDRSRRKHNQMAFRLKIVGRARPMQKHTAPRDRRPQKNKESLARGSPTPSRSSPNFLFHSGEIPAALKKIVNLATIRDQSSRYYASCEW